MGRRLAGPFLFGLMLLGCPARADEALITAQGANVLAIVDLTAGTVAAQVPIDGAPAGIALSPDRRTAYVTRPEGRASPWSISPPAR